MKVNSNLKLATNKDKRSVVHEFPIQEYMIFLEAQDHLKIQR